MYVQYFRQWPFTWRRRRPIDHVNISARTDISISQIDPIRVIVQRRKIS